MSHLIIYEWQYQSFHHLVTIQNRTSYFNDTWYEYDAAGDQLIVTYFYVLPSVIPTWLLREFLKSEHKLHCLKQEKNFLTGAISVKFFSLQKKKFGGKIFHILPHALFTLTLIENDIDFCSRDRY
jgi:hypothetical protein